jgi:predicted ATPase
MINPLFLAGYKCFFEEKIELNNLTIFTGSNGTGKSSVVQSLLLFRLSIEKNIKDLNNGNYIGTTWVGNHIPLNGEYELALGTFFDIFNEKIKKDNSIKIKLDDEEIELITPENDNENHLIKPLLVNSALNINEIPFWRKKEFYYLNAERIGPRFGLISNSTDFINCGYKGEYTAQAIRESEFVKINGNRLFKGSKNEYLPGQVDEWMSYLFRGINIKVESLGTMYNQIRLRNNSISTDKFPTNMGFGISYALPIIVTGLIAQEGCIFIVENPEAHLHPKAQSNIGYFLARIAASGVKVLIETHSEHVINGIRRSMLSEQGLTNENINLFFFNDNHNQSNRITKINIAPNGNLSDFPIDFFDQVRQDLLEIFKLSKK